MIPLHTLKVASPCPADWDAMPGDDQIRFCDGCRKNIYNLSEMTGDEAQALVNRLEGRLCVRFYTRADGTLLTQNCPVGLRAVRRKLVKKLSYAAALLLSCASGLLRGTSPAQAVTHARRHAAKPQAATPPRGLTSTTGAPLPAHPLMGKPIAPGHVTGKPGKPHLPPTMGVPAMPAPKL